MCIVPILRALLTHLNLTNTLRGGYYYHHPHFRDGEAEAQRGSDLPRVPQPVSDRAGIQTPGP